MLSKLKKLEKILIEKSYRKALFKKSAAGIEHENSLNGLNCKTIIDVGANKGQFALVARKAFPESKIYAFEPLLNPSKIFENVFRIDPKVKLYRYAVSDLTGKTFIHISHREDSSSLLPISDKQNEFFPGTYEVRLEKINAVRLFEVIKPEDIEPPAMLKIDVQGFELNVLKGCEELLDLFQYIYSECSYIELYTGQALIPEIESYLYKKRFKKIKEFNTVFDLFGNPLQSDFLFEKK